MVMLTAAAASPVVKSPVRKSSSSPPAVKKVRALNAPVLMTVIDLTDMQLVSVDDDDLCVECQKPMNTSEHYKSVSHFIADNYMLVCSVLHSVH